MMTESYLSRPKSFVFVRHVSQILYSSEVLGVEALADSSASDPAKASTPDCQPECHHLHNALRSVILSRSEGSPVLGREILRCGSG